MLGACIWGASRIQIIHIEHPAALGHFNVPPSNVYFRLRKLVPFNLAHRIWLLSVHPIHSSHSLLEYRLVRAWRIDLVRRAAAGLEEHAVAYISC